MNRATIFIARERENVMSEPVAALAQEAPDSARWRNPYAILPSLRWVVQGASLFFFVLVGIKFHSFYRQIVSGGPVTVRRRWKDSCPSAPWWA
jgi:hypothetical protein